MGKATRRKQEAEAAREPKWDLSLQKSKEVEAKKEAELASFNPLSLIKGYEERALRPLEKFMPRTRSLNTETRGRELIRYAFNKYNPPPFLYQVWNSEREAQNTYLFGLKEDFRHWYLSLVQGGSLYKECSMGLLTKRETFFFSTCPYPMTIPQVVWYSIIRCMDENASPSVARKIASTKLSENGIDDFWRGVARWFMLNDTSVRQMNDLLDYISNRHREHAEWYIRDQTLIGLQKAMQSWHRELYRTRTMVRQYEKWDGIDVKDSQFERGFGKKKTVYHFHQIKTGIELSKEGNAQHHCVSSYGSRCHSGQCSIWSMTQRDEFGTFKRVLTIEVTNTKEIIQARGYANRLPKADEMSMLREWAGNVGFRVRV